MRTPPKKKPKKKSLSKDKKMIVDLQLLRAYQCGVLYARLKGIKEDLHMGRQKEALTEVSDILKYMETEMIPEFCPAKADKADRADRADRADKTEKTEKTDKTEKAETISSAPDEL